jgi:hypothetical protein
VTDGIRPFVERDLPEIAALHGRIYPTGAGGSLERRTAYLRRILLEHPWRTDRLPSLVCEAGGGRLIGLLGVMPRPMRVHGRIIYMAVGHNFMVNPEDRHSLAGLKLLRTFLAGEQELSLCEPVGESTRKMWEALGGAVAPLQSLHWTWPLRPVGYLVAWLQGRGLPERIGVALGPACRLLDAVLARARRHSGRPPRTRRQHLTVEELRPLADELAEGYAVRPVYDDRTLRWLLGVLAGKKRWGKLRIRSVHALDGPTLGYYLYYANEGGVSPVLQIGARPGAMEAVVDDLTDDAWSTGALALSGRLDQRYAELISDRGSYFKYTGSPLLFHTRDPGLQSAIYKGMRS